ncbi:MAG: SDR family NAD(P)-dependent oxidoreductase [Planctomycetota bacterium]|nr:SDR family NAD(P)-dependent oxidoreductase [Planctomycetota bacterium]MDA1262447.1 SDR family NAD(P)-dependent oxidoreductase [Planctomycetota bacterium]
MAIQLEGKVAIITGASSGIGAATARAMAKAGIDVVLVARRRDRLEEVAKSIRDLGRRAHIVVGDVSDAPHVKIALDEAERHFGRFDIVFANAGYGMERPVHLMEDTELRAMFEVNFFSSVALLRESAKRLRAAKRSGHLLMCSSCLSKFSMPDLGAYAASKAAQEAICRAMRFELAADHIEVASVHPVTTTTEFFEQSAQRSATQGGSVHEHAPKWIVQSPDRVANAIVACLRRPRSEVWTSHIVRFSSALFTAFPWILDLILRREAKRQIRRRAHSSKTTAKVP